MKRTKPVILSSSHSAELYVPRSPRRGVSPRKHAGESLLMGLNLSPDRIAKLIRSPADTEAASALYLDEREILWILYWKAA
jgi:hypothetical protein